MDLPKECEGVLDELREYRIATESGDIARAHEVAKRAAQLAPGCALAHHSHAFALQGLGRYSEAVEAYAREIAIDENDAVAYYNLGFALAKLGRRERAIDAYRKSISLDPNFASAYVNLAAQYAGIQDYKEARKLSQTAVQLAPENSNARLSLAHALEGLAKRAQSAEQNGLLAAAIEQYWEILQIESRNADALRGLGKCYAGLGQFENAREKLIEAYRLEPTAPGIKTLIALNYMMRLQFGNAIRAMFGKV